MFRKAVLEEFNRLAREGVSVPDSSEVVETELETFAESVVFA